MVEFTPPPPSLEAGVAFEALEAPAAFVATLILQESCHCPNKTCTPGVWDRPADPTAPAGSVRAVALLHLLAIDVRFGLARLVRSLFERAVIGSPLLEAGVRWPAGENRSLLSFSNRCWRAQTPPKKERRRSPACSLARSRAVRGSSSVDGSILKPINRRRKREVEASSTPFSERQLAFSRQFSKWKVESRRVFCSLVVIGLLSRAQA